MNGRTAEELPARYSSIDDVLGPASLRFFGEGYRRTRPRLWNIAVTHDTTASRLSASGSIAIGHAWSVKHGQQQRPHLATTDAVALTAQGVGALLTARFDAATAAAALITDLGVRAAGEPMEDDLGEFPITVELRGSAGESAAEFTAQIGSMTTTGSVTRPQGTADLAAPARSFATPWSGPYGRGLAARSQQLTDVCVDRDVAFATSSLVSPAADAVRRGLESQAQPAYTLVDVFVAALQLGQVVLYDLDSVERGSSSTLWMRRTEICTDRALPARIDPVPVRVALERARLVERGGETWRLADVVGELGPYRTRVAVAHRLGPPDP
ncbi:AvrD family protein [Cellulomonas sp. GbtcB1]|uniref:AvrD family protein n=1 Tax=Cellulomonas sp. GbtcB1 TaxID=2824746 RepID=UPI001C301473|nr:AvrD family protein [Cellulomonas sp. GbtcB1]